MVIYVNWMTLWRENIGEASSPMDGLGGYKSPIALQSTTYGLLTASEMSSVP